MTVEGATTVVVGAGYPAKRRIYERMHDLGARVVVVDEAGHWSRQLAEHGVAANWLAAEIVGDLALSDEDVTIDMDDSDETVLEYADPADTATTKRARLPKVTVRRR